MEPKVSVVIPVYNVEAYLKRCVDSVIGQTYQNIEIVLVDDGSTDSSGKICDEYRENCDRVRVVHQENGGVSLARNTGVDTASGDYVVFVDSDDYAMPTYVEYLVGLALEFDAELAMCGHTVICEDGKRLNYVSDFRGVYDKKDCQEKILYQEVLGTSPWGKIYAKRLFEKVRFPAGRLYEDAATVYLFVDEANKIAVGGKPQYYYMVRQNSIVTKTFSRSKLDLLWATDNMAEYLENKYPELHSAILRRSVYARFSTLNQMLYTSECGKERKEIIDYIKKNSKEVLSDPRTPKRDKVAIYLLKTGFPVYRFFWKLYLKVFK